MTRKSRIPSVHERHSVMRSLRFDSNITGISPFKESFLVTTEQDGIYVIKVGDMSIRRQITLPSNLIPNGKALWSRDGDFIWIPTGNTISFTRIQNTQEFKQLDLPSPVVKIFNHHNGFGILAVLENKEIRYLNARGDDEAIKYGPFGDNENIISIVQFQKKLFAIVDAKTPYIEILDSKQLTKIDSIDIEHRSSTIITALASDFGVVVIWADGAWIRYNDVGEVSRGTAAAAADYSLIGSHLGAACGDKILIYDLKFDAELQSITVPAHQLALFEGQLVAVSDNALEFREWVGAASTTTRSLIGTATRAEPREELNIALVLEEGLQQPKTCDVQSEPAKIHVKSLRHAVDAAMEDRFLTTAAREKALKMAAAEEEKDLKDLARFQLSTVVPFDEVLAAVEDGAFDTAAMLLKKVENLSKEQICVLIQALLPALETNEIVLAHLVTQPLAEDSLAGGLSLLSSSEADQLMAFLARLLVSRRQWTDFEASMTAIDAVGRWASLLIQAHLTALRLEGKLDGARALKEALEEERARIARAGDCWAILKNINGQRQTDAPPTFMYIVETLSIPE